MTVALELVPWASLSIHGGSVNILAFIPKMVPTILAIFKVVDTKI
jgi:hypothetical protein